MSAEVAEVADIPSLTVHLKASRRLHTRTSHRLHGRTARHLRSRAVVLRSQQQKTHRHDRHLCHA